MSHKHMCALALTMAISTSVIVAPNASAQSSDLSSGSSSSSSDSNKSSGSSGSSDLWERILKLLGRSKIVPLIMQVSPGIITKKMGDILGRGISDHVGAMAGDLGIMVPINKNKEFAIIFGASFSGNGFGQGNWMSPIGAIATYDDNGQIVVKRPLNKGDRIEQLLKYNHDNNLTLIPSDVINLDGTLYMQGMWNEGLGNVRGTQIWKSTDQGKTWSSVATTSKHFMNGFGDLLTWERGDDGYVYVMSSRFNRNDGVYLSRFRPEQIGDRNTWEHYVNGSWEANGGRNISPIIKDDMKAGEMSLRRIEDHWVLCMFNEKTASIEVRISDRIDTNWNDIKPAHVVVAGNGGWGAAQTPNNFTQLYGGYIAPGSTIADMNIVVSQWNTSNNSRYMSTQFNVKGLDKFFGITPKAEEVAANGAQAKPELQNAPAPANHDGSDNQGSGVGDDRQIEVRESPVDPKVSGQLAEEKAAEAAADVTVVPLDEEHQ